MHTKIVVLIKNFACKIKNSSLSQTSHICTISFFVDLTPSFALLHSWIRQSTTITKPMTSHDKWLHIGSKLNGICQRTSGKLGNGTFFNILFAVIKK